MKKTIFFIGLFIFAISINLYAQEYKGFLGDIPCELSIKPNVVKGNYTITIRAMGKDASETFDVDKNEFNGEVRYGIYDSKRDFIFSLKDVSREFGKPAGQIMLGNIQDWSGYGRKFIEIAFYKK